jgi:hypothetical protein
MGLMSIVGPGTGSFTLGFGQVHMIAQASLKRKHAVMVGAGSGVGASHIRMIGTRNSDIVLP